MARINHIRVSVSERRKKPYPWEDEAWLNAASSNLNHIDVAFDLLRIPNRPKITSDLHREIGNVVKTFPSEFAPLEVGGIGYHRPASTRALTSVAGTISNWVRGIKVKEEDQMTITEEVPLCIFNCPDLPKAKTTLSQSKTTAGEVGWSIDVLGTGYGSDVTLTVAQTNEFSASAGECLLIFAPVPVRIVKCALYKHGSLQERFLKAEVGQSRARSANGVRSVDKDEWGKLIAGGQFFMNFPLSQDHGTELAKYTQKETLSGSFEFTMGLDAFKIKSSITAKCTAAQETALALELPPGRMYELWKAKAVSGYFFP